MLGGPGNKPSYGTRLDPFSSLGSGLVWMGPCNEGGGAIVTDVVGGVNLPTSSPPPWTYGGSEYYGSGLKCASTNVGASTLIPPLLKLQAPLTLACGFRLLSAGGALNGAYLIGLFLNNVGSPQYTAAGLRFDSSTDLGLIASTSSNVNVVSGFAPVAGQDYVVVAVFRSTSYSIYPFPVGGAPGAVVNGNWSNSPLSASYTATATLGLGANSATTGSPDSNIYWGAIWNRGLSAGEALSCGYTIWQLFSSPNVGIFKPSLVAFPRNPIVIRQPRQLVRPPQSIRLRQTIPGIAPTVPPIAFNLNAWAARLLSSDSDPLAVDASQAEIVD